MKKFVMLDSHTFPDADFHQEKDILSANGIECVIARCKTMNEVVACAADAQCIGLNTFRIDEALLSRLPNLKGVVRYGIGHDSVDADACSRRGILLCNLPFYCVTEVATHTMALLLDINRKTTLFDRHVRSGAWDVSYGYRTHRLSTRTLGMIGFGNIARQFSQYARAFGMQMIAYDPYLPQTVFEEHGVEGVELEEVYRRSDIISLHVPCSPKTHHIIDSHSIAKMKDGVMLLNTSRGPLVDIKALAAALLSGKVLAAGLDVVEGEPIEDAACPIFQCENLVVTPHTSYNSVEASEDQHTQVAETVLRILTGETPPYVVNKKS